MPTGYTARIIEKEGYTFKEFAMQCARAFGACVEMRDSPHDEPIPEKFEPSDYSVNRLAESEAELKRLNAMSPEERLAFGVAEKVKRIQSAAKYLERSRAESAKYQAMLAEVNKWMPPTPDHVGLKDFMVQQITISDTGNKYAEESLATANAADPLEIWAESVESEKRSIAYHTKGAAEDKARAESRTQWVQQLRTSL